MDIKVNKTIIDDKVDLNDSDDKINIDIDRKMQYKGIMKK